MIGNTVRYVYHSYLILFLVYLVLEIQFEDVQNLLA